MMDSGIVVLAIIGTVAIALLGFSLLSRRMLPEEKNMMPLFSEKCSATRRAGFSFRMGSNLPTSRITLYERTVVLAVGPPVMVKYEDIEQVKCERSWLSKRVEISIREPHMVLTFNVRAPDELAEAFRTRGVHVIET
jgi:hypothetical protein